MAAGNVTCNLTNALPKRCAVFDEVDDYVNCGNDESLDVTNALTINMWIYTNVHQSGDYNCVDLIYKNWASAWQLSLQSNEKLRFSAQVGGVGQEKTSTGTINLNQLNHIVVVFNTSNVKFYFNGEETDNFAYSTPGNLGINTVNLLIGKGAAGHERFFDGSISDVRIYNRALSETEIKQLYQGKNIKEGLVSRWKLDKDYKDSVGNNDGTNYGSYLTTVDDKVATTIKDARTTANDKYLMCVVNNKIMTSVIEEAA